MERLDCSGNSPNNFSSCQTIWSQPSVEEVKQRSDALRAAGVQLAKLRSQNRALKVKALGAEDMLRALKKLPKGSRVTGRQGEVHKAETPEEPVKSLQSTV